MPFLFSHVCDLLERLERLEKKGLKATEIEGRTTGLVYDWFNHFKEDLILDKSTWLPLFSILLPDLRCDRVYGFREHGLVNCISSSLCLGKSRKEELEAYRLKADGDLGKAVERVMAKAENIISRDARPSIQQIEVALDELAGLSSFSSEELVSARRNRKSITMSSTNSSTQQSQANENWLLSRKGILSPIYSHLTSRDAKWLTRVILKCVLPVKLEKNTVFRALHFALPDIFSFRSDLKMALDLLGRPSFRIFPDHPADKDMAELRAAVGRLLVPEVGIKVGRPFFVKATSFENVFRTVGKRRVAMERKYDGEYCQIHIDLEAGANWLRIFSKSGRDSTLDRHAAHDTIRECLRIDKPSLRAFNRKCIVECEFLIYCEQEQRILEFHHIKDHVPRAGRLINATPGGPSSSQHVLLKFFDCILLDDVCLPCHSYDARRSHLEKAVTIIPNRAELGERTILDFNLGKPTKELFAREFAKAISKRWEGYVVKPCGGPYMQWGSSNVWIKLKKDYIPGLGDTMDLCIVGGAVEANRSRERKLSSQTPTTFHIGCLTNRNDVISVRAVPKFKVLFTVSYCLTKPDLEYLRIQRNFRSKEYKSGSKGNRSSEFEIESVANGLIDPDFLFDKPIVFEVMGAGFDKVNSFSDWILRWPRVLKIYADREYLDAVDFDDFQKMAGEATAQPSDLAKVEQEWMCKFIGAASPPPPPPPPLPQPTPALPPTPRSLPAVKKVKNKIVERKSVSFYDPSPVLSQESFSSMNIPTCFKRPASFSEAYYPTLTPTPTSAKRQKRDIENTPPVTPSTPFITTSPPSSARAAAIRSSPLHSRTVYLTKYLTSNNPDITALLSRHGISTLGTTDDVLRTLTLSTPSPSASPTRRGRSSPPLASSSQAVVLVEERKRSEVQSLISSMMSFGVRNVEMYSWRILKRIEALSKSSSDVQMQDEDWSLFHISSF